MTQCRFCGTKLEQTLVDLGSTPLSNGYLTKEQLDNPEPSYPLHARVCSECRLVQVDDVVPPSDIFSEYQYFSSYSKPWIEHTKKFTEMAIKRWNLNSDSKVIEIASNDGCLLRHFVKENIPVLGVEPAANVAKVAIENGVPTDVSFFGKETATRISKDGKADLIVGNNVFAHVPDINDFVSGLKILLKDEGVVSLEFPHLLNLINEVQFDTIYHEHFSYISLYAAEKIFNTHGLRVFDVTELPTHGGSLRLMGCHNEASFQECSNLFKVRNDEIQARLDQDSGYQNLADKVKRLKIDLLDFLNIAKQENKNVVAFGAAAKGNTFLNYCNITTDLVSYVVDDTPYKQNLYMPGSRLPIYASEKIQETKPDYVLILPWNWKSEIANKMSSIRDWDGKFVVAAPKLEIF
jgi:SAM-dependent methyltransferase